MVAARPRYKNSIFYYFCCNSRWQHTKSQYCKKKKKHCVYRYITENVYLAVAQYKSEYCSFMQEGSML